MIEIDGISKHYPGVTALSEVSFAIREGEVLALAGENGSGKSTMMKILAGHIQPDGGRILLDGEPVQFHTPTDAVAAGIGLVEQELAVATHLTVGENILLGAPPPSLRRAHRLARRAATGPRDHGPARDRRQPARDTRGAARQRAAARGDRVRARPEAQGHAARRGDELALRERDRPRALHRPLAARPGHVDRLHLASHARDAPGRGSDRRAARRRGQRRGHDRRRQR
ncbi:MAG: sugar ABC transporter ATP-binding protein [Candidatus Leucobacter sulfamidivorax]|nr:sugar ABC transporter ATP-binding protein [Candidatus Leucobacter sulfamidivorax]